MWEDLGQIIEESESRRNGYFEQLGQLDGNWRTIVNPRFTEDQEPVWPTSPAWQRIQSGQTTMIASSGLSDPWYESEEPNIGLGIELLIATNDELPADATKMMTTWLYQLAIALATGAAVDGQCRLRHEKYGLFLYGVQTNGVSDVLDNWVCYDDRFGFLVGIPIPHQNMTFELPGGEACLLTAKLLTPSEYRFVADNGPEGAARLSQEFAANGSHHLSSLARPSVV